MVNPRITFAVVLAAGMLATGCAAPDRTSERLEAAITAAMAEAAIPGALVGVWSPDGSYVQAFGVADTSSGSPMKTDLYSRIGSVTKTFTATAVLQLVDEGKVGLDDPIAAYVPEVPNGEAITVRQLATMRSGLADYSDADGFAASVSADPRRELAPRQLLDWAFAEPPAFPPGQNWKYCNTNYILLGLLIEKVSGQSLPEYLNARIAGPLTLSDTSLPTGTEIPDPHPQGYTEPETDGGPPVDATRWSASMTGAAGAMISTLQDMSVWAPAVATGALVSPELQRERLLSASGDDLPPGVSYGIGVLNADGWIGHNGSVPGYQSVVIYRPERETTVVVLLNTDIELPDGRLPSSVLAEAVTSVITPDHAYRV